MSQRYQDLPLRQRKQARTRVGLLAALVERLDDRELDDVAVAELCEAVQISEATFFNHFKRKSDLLVYYVQLWTLEMGGVARRLLSDRGARAAIDAIFEATAHRVALHPGVMAEIIAWQVKSSSPPVMQVVGDAERLLALPDIEDVLELPVQGLDALLPWLLGEALKAGEIPANTDLGLLGHTLASIFFGVPAMRCRRDPGSVAGLYREQLELVWAGALAITFTQGSRA